MLVVDAAPVMFFSLGYCSFGRRCQTVVTKALDSAAREPAARRLNILSASAIVNDMRFPRGAAPAENAAIAGRVDRCLRPHKKNPARAGLLRRGQRQELHVHAAHA